MTHRTLTSVLALSTLTALVAFASLSPAATGAPTVSVHGAWVRPTPPGADTAAVYATVENAGGKADRLVAVETDAAQAAELHSMKMDGGMMVMRMVKGGLAVPAHGSLEFRPGGYHIMLIQPKAQIRPGDTISVTLIFEHAGRIALNVKARADGAAAPMSMGPHAGAPAGSHGAMPGMSSAAPAKPR